MTECCTPHQAAAIDTCRHCHAPLCADCARADRDGLPCCAGCRERLATERPLGSWLLVAVPFLAWPPLRFLLTLGDGFRRLRDDSLTLLEGSSAPWMAPTAWRVLGHGVLAVLAIAALRAFFARRASTVVRAELVFVAWAVVEVIAVVLGHVAGLERSRSEGVESALVVAAGVGWAAAFWLGKRPRETFTR